jgi:hypothetical protein
MWLEFAAWERDASVGIVPEDLRRILRRRAFAPGRVIAAGGKALWPPAALMTAMEVTALRPELAVAVLRRSSADKIRDERPTVLDPFRTFR